MNHGANCAWCAVLPTFPSGQLKGILCVLLAAVYQAARGALRGVTTSSLARKL